jgi:hypothetical protein
MRGGGGGVIALRWILGRNVKCIGSGFNSVRIVSDGGF